MSSLDNPNNAAGDLRRDTETLAEVNLRLRRQLEVAELLIPKLNELLHQLHAIRFADTTMIVGPVVHQQPYLTLLGPEDSGQVFQSALALPGGIGVLILDSVEYLDFENDPAQAAKYRPRRFQPFKECTSAVKARLLPETHRLLSRLFATLAIAGS